MSELFTKWMWLLELLTTTSWRCMWNVTFTCNKYEPKGLNSTSQGYKSIPSKVCLCEMGAREAVDTGFHGWRDGPFIQQSVGKCDRNWAFWTSYMHFTWHMTSEGGERVSNCRETQENLSQSRRKLLLESWFVFYTLYSPYVGFIKRWFTFQSGNNPKHKAKATQT